MEYSGLEHFIDVPIKNYSSGMHMRLGFAIAANLDPDILLLDEIFAVGDADFQQRCVDTIKGFLEQGKTIIFVSHSPAAVRSICRRVVCPRSGRAGLRRRRRRRSALLQHAAASRRKRRPGSSSRGSRIGAEPDVEDGNSGAWMFDFLEREGLRPSDRVLHLGERERGRHGTLALLSR